MHYISHWLNFPNSEKHRNHFWKNLTFCRKKAFFQILALTVDVVINISPDEDQVAPALKVAQFDCSEKTENTLYAINQVRPCHITPEKLEINKATVVLYTKHF